MASRKQRIAALKSQIVMEEVSVTKLTFDVSCNERLAEEASSLEKKYRQDADNYREARNSAQQGLTTAKNTVAALDEQIQNLRSKLAKIQQTSAELDAECDTLKDKTKVLNEHVIVLAAKRDRRYLELAKEALQLISEKTGQQIDTGDDTLNNILNLSRSKGLSKTIGEDA